MAAKALAATHPPSQACHQRCCKGAVRAAREAGGRGEVVKGAEAMEEREAVAWEAPTPFAPAPLVAAPEVALEPGGEAWKQTAHRHGLGVAALQRRSPGKNTNDQHAHPAHSSVRLTAACSSQLTEVVEAGVGWVAAARAASVVGVAWEEAASVAEGCTPAAKAEEAGGASAHRALSNGR